MRHILRFLESSDDYYIVGVKKSNLSIAANDFIQGILKYKLWMFLGWQDIKQRYRRSILGPFWLTLSTCIMVFAMSLLYGRLFKMSMETYAPFLATGTIFWAFFTSIINDSCQVFLDADSLIKQVRLPISLYAFRMVWRNLLILCHTIIVFIPVCYFYNRNIEVLSIIYFVFGLFFICITGVWVGVVLGAFCTRFRDISQIVMNLMQIAFFVTPVMWMPSILEGRGMAWWLININPFYHYLEILRAPLLENTFPRYSWSVVLGVTSLVVLLGLLMLGKFKNRIAYWL